MDAEQWVAFEDVDKRPHLVRAGCIRSVVACEGNEPEQCETIAMRGFPPGFVIHIQAAANGVGDRVRVTVAEGRRLMALMAPERQAQREEGE